LTSDLDESGSRLVLDTSALINMLGCSSAALVLRCLGRICVVEERVLKELAYHPIELRDAQQEVRDLGSAGLLEVMRMTDEEYEIYLALAAASGRPGLGVGESAAIAVSAIRGHVVVLDDRKARRRTVTQFPNLKVVSSTKVLLEAAHAGQLSLEETRSLFVAALGNASMGILKEERDLVAHLDLDAVGNA
jgi:predicted nucleic acid-binding protein